MHYAFIFYLFFEKFLVCKKWMKKELLKKFQQIKSQFWANSVRKEIVIFYTEILTGKVVLWCFFSSETSEIIYNSTFQVKISV